MYPHTMVLPSYEEVGHIDTRAQLARKIQVLVGRPELKDFIAYLDNNMLPNSPID
jgi:hypothetical protein